MSVQTDYDSQSTSIATPTWGIEDVASAHLGAGQVSSNVYVTVPGPASVGASRKPLCSG
jgi:hypothetical protein